ncbi:uncharacterized protein LOC134257562 [Saccostrea cucullata]|uniref:uncharacterized protein LOC134257562 n=1 Tax=Saccostrea cuccullata TaxID=36930 RepID=UPI002ED212A2
MTGLPVIFVCLMLPQYIVCIHGPGSRVYHLMKQRQMNLKCPCKRSISEVKGETEVPELGQEDIQLLLLGKTIPKREVKRDQTLGRILKSGITPDDLTRKTRSRLK